MAARLAPLLACAASGLMTLAGAAHALAPSSAIGGVVQWQRS